MNWAFLNMPNKEGVQGGMGDIYGRVISLLGGMRYEEYGGGSQQSIC